MENQNNDTLNILVIGNGFDLAHGLPTRYKHFLKFCSEITSVDWTSHLFDFTECGTHMPFICERISHSDISTINIRKVFLDVAEQLSNNIWYTYFQTISDKYMQGDRWIDFENEICFCINSLDTYTQDMFASVEGYLAEIERSEKLANLQQLQEVFNRLSALNPLTTDKKYLYDNEKTKVEVSQQISQMHLSGYDLLKKIEFARSVRTCIKDLDINTLEQLREKLFDDLQRFTHAFEIYLDKIVEQTKIEEKSPDIELTKARYIFSFNYTHTFLDGYLYKIPLANRIFAHGNCRVQKNIDYTRDLNIVLGIGEYCEGHLRDKNTNYLQFKKAFQRLEKETNVEVDNFFFMCENIKKMKYFFIFGHSLSETDKDILHTIFTMEYSKSTVFCFSKEDKKSYIENVVKIIGQDKLLDKIKKKEIEFKMQQSMIKLEKPLYYNTYKQEHSHV